MALPSPRILRTVGRGKQKLGRFVPILHHLPGQVSELGSRHSICEVRFSANGPRPRKYHAFFRIALPIVQVDLHAKLIAVPKGFDFQTEFSQLGSNPRWIDDLTSSISPVMRVFPIQAIQSRQPLEKSSIKRLGLFGRFDFGFSQILGINSLVLGTEGQ